MSGFTKAGTRLVAIAHTAAWGVIPAASGVIRTAVSGVMRTAASDVMRTAVSGVFGTAVSGVFGTAVSGVFGTAVSAALLAAVSAVVLPAAPAVASEPPEEAVIAVLPFVANSPANRVMIDLAPEGGRPWIMLLDTGASESVLTPGMARELGVSVRRTKETPYRKETRLGRDLQFWIDVQTSDTASKTGFEYGLLGGEFLDDYVLEIDFPGRQVRFLDPKKFQVPEQVVAEDERVVEFRRAGTRIAVPIGLNGREIRVLLDTGAPDPLILSGKAARKLGLDVEAMPEFGSVGTVKGPMKVRFHETASFRFGGFAFEPMPVLVAPRGWYNQGGSNDSVIGYDVLQQFRLRIDYERRRLWLKRTGSTRATFLGTDYVGAKQMGAYLNEFQPGHFVVWGLVPDGLAARTGVREEDVIFAAEGEPAMTAQEALACMREGRALRVARREGDSWVGLLLNEPAPAGENASDGPAPD